MAMNQYGQKSSSNSCETEDVNTLIASAAGYMLGGAAGSSVGAEIGKEFSPQYGATIGSWIGGVLGAIAGEAIAKDAAKETEFRCEKCGRCYKAIAVSAFWQTCCSNCST